jgi:hypothetical protein
MPGELSFEDVFEDHRTKVGAEYVSFTLGPEATPEGLAEVLETIRAVSARYNSFTDLEKKEAEVARLRSVMGETIRFAQGHHDDSREELLQRLSKVFGKLDMVADVNLDKDIKWMIEQREKKGLSLPQGV